MYRLSGYSGSNNVIRGLTGRIKTKTVGSYIRGGYRCHYENFCLENYSEETSVGRLLKDGASLIFGLSTVTGWTRSGDMRTQSIR